MSKVILSGYIEVPQDDLDQVMQELPTHIKLTRAEPGCIVFEVNQDEDNPQRFSVYEEFLDNEAFERHQARVRSSRWGDVTGNVARHYQLSQEAT